jgi:hypothetical protein
MEVNEDTDQGGTTGHRVQYRCIAVAVVGRYVYLCSDIACQDGGIYLVYIEREAHRVYAMSGMPLASSIMARPSGIKYYRIHGIEVYAIHIFGCHQGYERVGCHITASLY